MLFNYPSVSCSQASDKQEIKKKNNQKDDAKKEDDLKTKNEDEDDSKIEDNPKVENDKKIKTIKR